MKYIAIRLYAIIFLSVVLSGNLYAQPENEPANPPRKEARPYKILANGKQVTVRSSPITYPMKLLGSRSSFPHFHRTLLEGPHTHAVAVVVGCTSYAKALWSWIQHPAHPMKLLGSLSSSSITRRLSGSKAGGLSC